MNATRHKIDMEHIKPLAVDIEGLCALLCMGKGTAAKVAEKAGARLELGDTRIVRYNVQKISEYLYESSY